MRLRGPALGVLLTLAPAAGLAQVVPERELEIVKAQFDAGNYSEALKRTNAAMAVANFSDGQRVDLHRIAALSAFNLGDGEGCAQHFLQLLQLNPDYVLDPFAAPPPALRRFEQVKKDNGDALNLVRQQLALRAEQERRAGAEREKQRLAEEERRRRLEDLSRGVTVRTVERQSMLVALLPFGAGQFQQGRNSVGVTFAVTEGALALTSLLGYLAHQAIYTPHTFSWTDRLTADGRYSVTVNWIPPARQGEADAWRWLTNLAGAGFYAAWALGAVEAGWHHQGQSVTETKETILAPPPAHSLRLQLVPGGAGATLSLGF